MGAPARGRAAAVWLCACFLVQVWARPAVADVGDYLGRPVAQVELRVEGHPVREEALLALVETRIGEPLRMVHVRETLDHLLSLDRYEDVQVRATLVGGRVALLYELVGLRRVRSFEFRGRPELDESMLGAAITERLGSVPPVGRAAEAARVLEDLYRNQGYRRATVAPSRRTEHALDRTTLVFDVVAGPRTRVRRVEVEGAAVTREVFMQRIGLQEGGPYLEAELAASLDRYRADLQAQGYYEAMVGHLPRLSEDELTVDLTVIVDQGRMVSLRFEGDPLPSGRRAQELVPIAREQSVDEDLLEDSKRRIEDALKELGYYEARVDYRRDEADGLLTVVFAVIRGPLHRLGTVAIEGSTMRDELRTLVRLKEGTPFVGAVLAGDVAAMEERYRRAGFGGVTIETAVSTAESDDGRRVTARLLVEEGVRSAIGNVTFDGNGALPDDLLRPIAGLVPGRPFYEPLTNLAADNVLIEYLNRGFPDALVSRVLSFRDDRRTVDVMFRVQEGVQAIVHRVLVVGNTRTRTALIEREIVLEPGAPLGQSALIESQRRLSALGLFRRVEIDQVRHPGDQARRDVLVIVEEARATTIGGGGGIEIGQRLRRSASGTGPAEERLELAPRAFFEIGRRNLWGKNRSITLFTRISFRPKDETAASGAPHDPPDDGYGFNEYRVLLNYSEPRVWGLADGAISAFVEQASRSSFNFSRRGTSVEIAHPLPGRMRLIGRYALEQTTLFNERYNPSERAAIDRLFPQVRLSSLSSSLIRNTRDDPVEPTRGTLVTLDGALAARALGSEVGFAKALLKGFLYRRVGGAGRVVFAGGATLGLADGFPRAVTVTNGTAVLETVRDLPASERFYAGGDTTVRGFALDRLGTADTIDEDGFPKGGQALVIFNAEMRVPVWRDFGAVGFIDVGNVFADIGAIDMGELRGGAGFGVRYRSPVGPTIRVDLGFKLSRLDVPRKESLTALHISIGQAF